MRPPGRSQCPLRADPKTAPAVPAGAQGSGTEMAQAAGSRAKAPEPPGPAAVAARTPMLEGVFRPTPGSGVPGAEPTGSLPSRVFRSRAETQLSCQATGPTKGRLASLA